MPTGTKSFDGINDFTGGGVTGGGVTGGGVTGGGVTGGGVTGGGVGGKVEEYILSIYWKSCYTVNNLLDTQSIIRRHSNKSPSSKMSTYINKNGQQAGPFTEDQVKESLKSGVYSPDDLCWKEGWESWKKLGSVYSERKSSTQNLGEGNPQTVSNFEKRIFGFTRWFVGTIAAGVVLLIVVLLIVVICPIGNSKVTYREVMGKKVTSNGINPVNSLISNYTGGGGEDEVKVRIPKNVEDEFQGNNAKILQNWIKECPASQQQDFVDNLSRLIEKGKQEGLSSDKMTDLENDYHKLKRQKIMSTEMMKYIALGVKLGAATLIFMLILILCIVSLILVLLAIERNTRARI